MTPSSDAETQRIPAEPRRTTEYLWPEATTATRVIDREPTPSPAPTPVAPLGAVEPELPVRRRAGNRVAGLLIVLVATAIFAALDTVVLALGQSVGGERAFADAARELAPQPIILAPTIGFALVFSMIVLVVNRAGWWAYVLGGFLVAVGAYATALAGVWIAANGLTMPVGRDALFLFLSDSALLPVVLAPAVLAREVAVWAGAWIAARARGVKRRNARPASVHS